MFICSKCGKCTKAREKQTKVVKEKRDQEYFNDVFLKRKKRTVTKHTTGWEIVSEMIICNSCAGIETPVGIKKDPQKPIKEFTRLRRGRFRNKLNFKRGNK